MGDPRLWAGVSFAEGLKMDADDHGSNTACGEGEHSTGVEWLASRLPGFAVLPARDREAIVSFAFLWSFFEARLMENGANAKRIAGLVDQWNAAGELDADLYDAELAYFKDRYFRHGEFTPRFGKLNLRRADMPDLVASVIRGVNDDVRDGVLTLLLIVWRLRNNLFHGEKWAYWLEGQRDNFDHANAALIRILERHGFH